MLTNYHTHTTFCDGKHTPEETVLAAISKGFAALGFSSHGSSPRYGLRNIDDYLAEIARLKEKYKDTIQIYAGIEEDASTFLDRSKFDYIIGSMHYMHIGGEYYPIDTNSVLFAENLARFKGDTIAFARQYYEDFCGYIAARKPDIVGHFDLITKFDEMGASLFFEDPEYIELSQRYMAIAADNDVIFEINTGAISRGCRKTPYPHESLLHVLKKAGGKVTINSDAHSADAIDCHFPESRALLRDVGFTHTYVLYDGQFQKIPL